MVAGRTTIEADYRDLGLLADLIAEHGLTGVVSLFSVECTAPWAENQRFYECLFRGTGSQAILASGFYYGGRADQETVEEAGGITSHQSVVPIEKSRSAVFDEVRVMMPCPSRMFGDDVIEVWRLLTRIPDRDCLAGEAPRDLVA